MAQEAGAEVHVEPDATLYAALNRGLPMAAGEVVGWLNGDDTFDPEALAQVVRQFRSTPAAEIVVGDYAIGPSGQAVRRKTSADALRRIREGKPGRDCWVAPLAVFFRTGTLRGLGEYSTRYRVAGDLDMWLRAAARTPVPEVVHMGRSAGDLSRSRPVPQLGP